MALKTRLRNRYGGTDNIPTKPHTRMKHRIVLDVVCEELEFWYVISVNRETVLGWVKKTVDTNGKWIAGIDETELPGGPYLYRGRAVLEVLNQITKNETIIAFYSNLVKQP